MIHRQLVYLVLLFLLLSQGVASQPSDNPLMQKGWGLLIKDRDDLAFGCFSKAYEKAKKENNTAGKAEALLYLGICTYGSSLEKGLKYATKALDNYSKLEKTNPELSKVGRGKCLQLIGTIYTRQQRYKEAMPISREVIAILEQKKDKSGTLGLAYSNLANLYEQQQQQDSAAWFLKLALDDFEKSNNVAYLPGAYTRIGENELKKNHAENSLMYFKKALAIAESTDNKQAKVSGLMAIGKWYLKLNKFNEARKYFQEANQLAITLSDKIFEIKTLEALVQLNELQKNYAETARLQSRLLLIKEEFYSIEREKIVKSLEVQFDVTEKNRKLAFVSKEHEVSKLTNYLLGTGITVLLILFVIGYLYLKSINRRDRQLLKTKEALVNALEKQKKLKEIQFRNDMDHKESQLSGITLQMFQKNELLNEIKAAIDNQQPLSEQQLVKMVNRHFEQDNIWNDFDLYFESINKNFYTRLKQAHPEISGNDLKICALIKLNLSIKEMSSILNISPDSVKTSRYRLRKKLRLAADDNLTTFILSI